MPFENAGVFSPVGMVNLGNSLMVIKKLVYEQKIISLPELKKPWTLTGRAMRMCKECV